MNTKCPKDNYSYCAPLLHQKEPLMQLIKLNKLLMQMRKKPHKTDLNHRVNLINTMNTILYRVKLPILIFTLKPAI